MMENIQLINHGSIYLVFKFNNNTKMELLPISAEAYKTVLTRLGAIQKTLNEILTLLKTKQDNGSETLNHVTEKEALKLVGTKGTWFWLMRRSCQLKFTKVDSKVFYSVDELQKLVTEGGRV
jgi:hypothetical protein